MNPGFSTAAVFTATLSAPARSSPFMCSRLATPPPAVNGMNTSFETRSMRSATAARLSSVASVSRKISSSTPYES